MAIADIQTSLNGGELSPQLYAQVDLNKFQSGAALIRNFIVDYRGGVDFRPGTEFIYALDTDPPYTLIPFIVSTEAAYVLIFQAGKIWFVNDGEVLLSGGVPYSVTVPYTAADLPTLQYAQSADVMTLVHPSYPPANLTRTSDTTFTYAVISVGPDISPPVITDMRAPHSGPYNFGYLVTAVDVDGEEESLASNPGVKHSEGMNELTNRVIGLNWTAPAQPASRYNIYKWGPIDAVTMVPATVWGFIGSSQTVSFTDNNIAPDFAKQPPNWGDPFSGGQVQSIVVTAGGSGYDGVTGDWPAIPYVPLTFVGDGTGAAGYAVIDRANNEIIGAYITNAGKNYTTISATANGEGGTGATFAITLSDIDPIYPACVAYFQQRRTTAGATLKPDTVVMTQVGLYENYNTSQGALDDEAISFSLASTEVNTIKALVPVSYGLLAFTTGDIFLLNGGSPYEAITPANISAQSQNATGCNDLRPLKVNYDVLYGQAQGNRLRNLSYVWNRQTFTGSDITSLAPHLFDTYRTVDWTWSQEPFKTVHAIRDDGRMLTCTYVPDQEVFAWARHDTQGLFLNSVSVPEGDLNTVYVIVKRHLEQVGDPCWVYYLERFKPRQECCIYTAWHLDSALELEGCTDDFTVYLVGDITNPLATIDIYSYDPCTGTPSGSFALPCVTSIEITYTNYNPINAVQPLDGGVPVGTAGSRFTDANLNQYTAGNGGPWSCTDVNGLTLWNLEDADIGQLFIDAGADPGITFLMGVSGPFPSPDGSRLLFVVQGGFPSNFYIGVANLPATGVVALPVLLNYFRMPIAADQAYGAGMFGNIGTSDATASGMVMVTSDFSTTKTQFWLIPSIPEIIAGTFKGSHPGCTGTLAADQGPSWIINWTNNSALRSTYSTTAVQAGTVDSNGIGFFAHTGGTTRYYMVVPRAWMESGGSGIAAEFAGTNPDGGAYICPVGFSSYADLVWDPLAITEVVTNSSAVTDVTNSDFLDEDGAPTLPWSDEWTRILDEGPNSGWFASYGGRPQVVYEDGDPVLFFNIIDGNPTYATSIGGGQRVWYARVRGYKYRDGAFRQFSMANGLCFRQGDLGFSGYNFDGPMSQWVFVYDNEIYFQIGQWNGMGGAANSRSILTQFATYSSEFTTDDGLLFLATCGKINITEIVDNTHLRGTVEVDLNDAILPDDPEDTPIPLDVWTLITPVRTVGGLGHLEGKEVYALVDGEEVGPLTVTSGSVTVRTPLQDPASNVIVGLKYTGQIKTLYLDSSVLESGTIQGKRKKLNGVTLRVDCTRGLKAGTDFDHLTALPDLNPTTFTPTLFTGDARVLTYPNWDTEGEICVQQDHPYPASVNGIIVEVTPGDTGR